MSQRELQQLLKYFEPRLLAINHCNFQNIGLQALKSQPSLASLFLPSLSTGRTTIPQLTPLKTFSILSPQNAVYGRLFKLSNQASSYPSCKRTFCRQNPYRTSPHQAPSTIPSSKYLRKLCAMVLGGHVHTVQRTLQKLQLQSLITRYGSMDMTPTSLMISNGIHKTAYGLWTKTLKWPSWPSSMIDLIKKHSNYHMVLKARALPMVSFGSRIFTAMVPRIWIRSKPSRRD